MKNFLIAFLLLFSSPVFSQENDLLTYEIKNEFLLNENPNQDFIEYIKTDFQKDSSALLKIYESKNSLGNAKLNFEKDWKSLIVNKYKLAAEANYFNKEINPQIVLSTAIGNYVVKDNIHSDNWEILKGSLTDKKGHTYTLITATGYGKKISIVIQTETVKKETKLALVDFINSLKFHNPSSNNLNHRNIGSSDTIPKQEQLAKVINRPKSAPVPTIIFPLIQTGTPQEQADIFSKDFGSDNPSVRLAAIVSALSASGVPLIDSQGKSINGTGSDLLGLPWMQVVGVTVTNPSFSISFADAAKLLSLKHNSISSSESHKAIALLTAIREGLFSPNPQVQFFSNLIEKTNLRLGGPSFALDSTKPEQVRIDMPTLEVFMGRIMRLVLIEAVGIKESRNISKSDSKKNVFSSLKFNPLIREVYASNHINISGTNSNSAIPSGTESPPLNCSDDALNGWGIWLLSKGLGGVDMTSIGGEKAAWQGVTDWVVKNVIHSGEKITIDPSKLIKSSEFLIEYTGIVSSMFSVLNYLFERAMLHATVTMQGGEPLIRNKKKYDGDGQAKKLVAKFEMKMPKSRNKSDLLDPETDRLGVDALNCFLALGVYFGNNTFMPTEGPQANLRVEIEGGKGFTSGLDPGNSIVLFGPSNFEPHQDTDINGEITIPVQGRRQKKDHSDKAKPIDKEFSVILTSTLEPVDGSSAAKTFVDSLICVGSVGLGCSDAIADILKTIQYNVGEFNFRVKDWESNKKLSYKVEFQDPRTPELSIVESLETCEGPLGIFKGTITYLIKNNASNSGPRETSCFLAGNQTESMFKSIKSGGHGCIYYPPSDNDPGKLKFIIFFEGQIKEIATYSIEDLEGEECSIN